MTRPLMKKLLELEAAANPAPSPILIALLQLADKHGFDVSHLDQTDNAAITAALFELLPN